MAIRARSGGMRTAKPSSSPSPSPTWRTERRSASADNDQRYGGQGAFLIEAGISSSYHIAKFFGLTSWIRERKAVLVASPSAQLMPPVSPVSLAGQMPAIARVLRPERTPDDRAESQRQRQKDRGVRAALKRVLAAAGLKTQ